MATNQNESEKLVQAQIDIGVLQTQFDHQAKAMEGLRLGQVQIVEQLRALQNVLGEAKGGWRLLMLLGGAGAAFGGVISYVVEHFVWRP